MRSSKVHIVYIKYIYLYIYNMYTWYSSIVICESYVRLIYIYINMHIAYIIIYMVTTNKFLKIKNFGMCTHIFDYWLWQVGI